MELMNKMQWWINKIKWLMNMLTFDGYIVTVNHLINIRAFLHRVTACVSSDRTSIRFVKTVLFAFGNINAARLNGYKSKLLFPWKMQTNNSLFLLDWNGRHCYFASNRSAYAVVSKKGLGNAIWNVLSFLSRRLQMLNNHESGSLGWQDFSAPALNGVYDLQTWHVNGC